VIRSRSDQLPPPVLPLLYLGFAHGALALALVLVAVSPVSYAGFFYHPRMIAVVHLITLGWITFSILGALYIVGPLVLRMPMPARRLDYWAFAFNAIGVSGMVAHFWIAEYSGMAWAGIMVVAGTAYLAVRTFRGLGAAPIPLPVKLHVALAFANLLVAATFGVLLGFNKLRPFLPGFSVTNAYAHAHLAAIGWAGMMAVGVAYRLLPMVLPAAMPPASRLYATAFTLQVGSLGLAVSLMLQSGLVGAFALLTAAGLLTFLWHVRWMIRHPRPAPPALARPDHGRSQALASLAWLLVSLALGLALALAPAMAWTPRLIAAYGAAGLIGFLTQIIVAMSLRVLPLFAWYQAFRRMAFQDPAMSPHAMGIHVIQRAAFILWLAGVPVLVAALLLQAPALLAAAAWILLAAVALNTCNAIAIVRRGFTAGRTIPRVHPLR
jgi:hypothetical protein